MNKEAPVVSRLLQKRDLERNNQRLMQKLMSIKFSNISALKGASPEKRIPKVHHIEMGKILISSEQKQQRTKTFLNGERIREENKLIYSRLVNQKSTLPAKHLAEERLKNVEYLKRIRKYPYKRVQSVVGADEEDLVQKSDLRRHKTQYYSEEEDHFAFNIRSNTEKKPNLSIQWGEEEKKDHLIVLFSKTIMLSKNWYTVKVLRFKYHYELKLVSYPNSQIQYSLKLPEDIGTAILTQNDYDYPHICQKYIKMTHQYVCFSFELAGEEKKKYFYRFQKKILPPTPEDEKDYEMSREKGKDRERYEVLPKVQELKGEQSPTILRKTVFAMENQKKEREKMQMSRRKFKISPNKEMDFGENSDASGRIDIRLSSIQQG